MTMVTTDNGFRLMAGEHENTRELFVTTMENGSTYTVHVLTTEEPGNVDGKYGRKAVVVHPESGEHRSYSLFQAKVGDSYAVDSLAKAYGFVDDRSLLYIAVHNDTETPSTHYYSAEKLDILTGEKTVLIPRIQEFDSLTPPEHFAKGWLTETKEKLMLNSYKEGKLWSIDTASGDMQLLPALAKHHWPFFMTSVSPDGERIWHYDNENGRFALLDEGGTIINTYPLPSEWDRQQVGWFFWSPNGTYAVHYPTSNASANPIIHEDSEFVTRALESVSFYDREGKGRHLEFDRSSSPYVQVAGWLGEDDDFAVLRFYDVEKASGIGTPINESYILYELSTGKSIGLQETANEDKIATLEPVISYQNRPGVDESIFVVDRKAEAIVKLNARGAWIHDDEQRNGAVKAWIRQDETDGSAALLWTMDGSFGDLKELQLDSSKGEAVFAGESWIALPDMTFIRLE